MGLPDDFHVMKISQIKSNIVEMLQNSMGDTSDHDFVSAMNLLASYYSSRGFDERWGTSDTGPLAMDGKWTTLSKPTFSECRGRNERGECVYSLGRVAFDMFRPTSLVCSLSAVYILISPWSGTENDRPLYFPAGLQKSMGLSRKPPMRNYE